MCKWVGRLGTIGPYNFMQRLQCLKKQRISTFLFLDYVISNRALLFYSQITGYFLFSFKSTVTVFW